MSCIVIDYSWRCRAPNWKKKMKNSARQIVHFVCDCNDPSHQIIVDYWDDELDFVNMSVSMVDIKPFWRRIIPAIRYILGYRGKNDWYYADTLLAPEDVSRLRRFLDQFEVDRAAQRARGDEYVPLREFSQE